MRVAIDAMGGDDAPLVNVDGAIDAVEKQEDLEVILVGIEPVVRKHLDSRKYKGSRISIHHAPDVVKMDDPPSLAVRRKKDSSMRKAFDLVREGKADAVVSAGNSGAMMGMSLFLLGRAEGVDRPAFAALMPSYSKPFLLLDAGANVDCSPDNIIQFALMGNAYSRLVVGVDRPRVSLLSIGEEQMKGNVLIKESTKILLELGMNFTGNVEPKDAYMGVSDVIVCDGFVGNIFLKTSEGLAEFVMRLLKREMGRSVAAKMGYLFMRSVLKNVKKETAYEEYGGAPLLGIKGAVVVCHGRSTSKAIMNAIMIASEFASKNVHKAISKDIKMLVDKKDDKESTVAAG
ncbi:MAG: phosphate acyltransferase PlsX [Thermodesulfovibrionales bacterium]|nr:phosphate acyltransferase PlsX [Thermodesulfovibrionales bacterium]